MTNSVVCKFGGSSVANADQIEKVRRIVTANSQRRFVVVSAPGRIHKNEEKIEHTSWKNVRLLPQATASWQS